MIMFYAIHVYLYTNFGRTISIVHVRVNNFLICVHFPMVKHGQLDSGVRQHMDADQIGNIL